MKAKYVDNNGNQGETTFGTDWVSGILPGATIRSFILMESPSDDAASIRLVIPAGYDENFDQINFEFELELP